MIKYIFGKLFDVQYFPIYWMLEIYNLFLENFYDLYNALCCNFVLFYCCCSEVLLSA